MLTKTFTRFKNKSLLNTAKASFSFGAQSDKYEIDVNPANKYIHLTPKTNHKYSLIFLHGLGDTSMGFFDLFLDKKNEFNIVPKECRVVLPTAPIQPVTLNDGYEMNSWFDVFSLRPNQMEKIDDLYGKYC